MCHKPRIKFVSGIYGSTLCQSNQRALLGYALSNSDWGRVHEYWKQCRCVYFYIYTILGTNAKTPITVSFAVNRDACVSLKNHYCTVQWRVSLDGTIIRWDNYRFDSNNLPFFSSLCFNKALEPNTNIAYSTTVDDTVTLSTVTLL